MFGPVVGQVGFTGSPEESELILVSTTVSEPAELHVHGFSLSWLDMTVDDAFDSAVVSLYQCRVLCMP